ncbi:MAG TPA: hypothetical protein PKW94_00640 [Candidatus Dojkabacteria bacterium]|jgi:hypothetical protein|nr:hypothetical protein [Candidatus Dojkabacteria bacterium]HOT60796.1 hypothetical protein [Candidatus Dojkabacteria bacterium]
MVKIETTREDISRKRSVEDTKIVQRQNNVISTKESLNVSLRNSVYSISNVKFLFLEFRL